MQSSPPDITQPDIDSFHDAELLSIAIDRQNGDIVLSFIQTDGRSVKLRFRSVLSTKMSGILLQNVVSRILLSSLDNFEIQEIHRIVVWIYSNADGSVFVEREELDDIVNRVRSRQLKLFYLDPSVGAEVAIIFGTLAVIGDGASLS